MKKEHKKFKVGSLFAGVGGICLGFQNANAEDKAYELVFANEIDEYACETYRTNFNHTLLEGDIHKFLDTSLCKSKEEKEYYESKRHHLFDSKIDILNGGFPCQAFSIAGERKGFDDERGNLFLQIVELINQMDKYSQKPRVLFLENVKNLLSHDSGRTYKIIKAKLEECGYIIKEKVLNTMNYTNLPQNRERIYIVGFLNKEDADKFTFFDNSEKFIKKKSASERAKDVEKVINYNVNYTDNKEFYYTKEKYPHYFLEDGINLTKEVNEKYQFYQCRRGMYVRKNQSNVCPTLTANMGTGGHNVPLIKVDDGVRKLTPAETFRLQGFPVGKSYSLPVSFKGRPYSNSHLYKQAGNAVSVDVIQLLAEEILKILD
ncbi:DNA (cytosine-5-)-methyltransferase [bacterium]|nr:DNA (cytosine-5-)-methyltransferase [bacterium]